VEFISLIFRLGVVLAIFSFIWGIIQFGLTILRGGLPLPYPLALALKLIQYFLIVDITVLFCTTRTNTAQMDTLLSGFILLMYFVGKVQNMKTRFMVVQIQNMSRQQQPPAPPKMILEFGVIALSIALFVFLVIRPDFAYNNASVWFYKNILEIEKAPIFGFIFQVIGFFFTLTILFRMFSAFTLILSGQAFNKKGPGNDNNQRNDRNDNRFDDYEEVE